MPVVNRVASLVKRWIPGTHHGSVQPGHLDAYLDEFVFCFNRRTSTSRGMLFNQVMQQAVMTGPVTYQSVVEGLRLLGACRAFPATPSDRQLGQLRQFKHSPTV